MVSKICPNCKMEFACNTDNIEKCRCFDIRFSSEESNYMISKFNDCLCATCLELFQTEFGGIIKNEQIC